MFELKKFLATMSNADTKDPEEFLKILMAQGEEWPEFLDNCKVEGGKILHKHVDVDEFHFLISAMQSLAVADTAHTLAQGDYFKETMLTVALTGMVGEYKHYLDHLFMVALATMLGIALQDGWMDEHKELDINVSDL